MEGHVRNHSSIASYYEVGVQYNYIVSINVVTCDFEFRSL